MFFRILAVFLILPAIAFGQGITHCNAFSSPNSGPCLKNQEIISYEEIGGNTAQEQVVTRTINAPAKAVSNKAKDCGASDDCGPIFKRNEGCDSYFCRKAQEKQQEQVAKEEKQVEQAPVVADNSCRSKDCGPIFKRNEGCDKPECLKEKAVVEVVEDEPNCTTLCPQDVALAYEDLHNTCNGFASVYFQHVDFKLKKENKFANYVNKLGDYRFRIFGCRRNSKEIFLNAGRAMQNDMNFFDIYKNVYGSCIPQVKMPTDFCDENSNAPLPDYILTAEITDYAMNVCDEFDWKNTENKGLRSGSSEMTVVWRLFDPAKQKVLWKGSSIGYGNLEKGENNGEVLLVDRAFEDALTQLRYLDGFAQQAKRKPTAQEVQETRKILADIERTLHPEKCDLLEIIEVDQCPKCPECKTCEVEVEIPLESEEVVESSGIISEVSEIDEASGLDSFGNVDTVRVVEKEWVDITPIATEEVEEIIGGFCIENELTYKDMNPYNVYKTRASMVDISSPSGKKQGVGLIINDQFILTSADMISKDENTFNVKTINGVEFKADGFRFSPKKNVALLLAQDKMEYTPLPLELKLPPVGATGFMTLGMDLQEASGGEGYVDNETSIAGYRFSEDRGAEIITNQESQAQTVGGALVDDKGNIYGIAHYGHTKAGEQDMYMPVETALKSLNVEICGRDFLNQQPWKKTDIETKVFKSPEAMQEANIK